MAPGSCIMHHASGLFLNNIDTRFREFRASVSSRFPASQHRAIKRLCNNRCINITILSVLTIVRDQATAGQTPNTVQWLDTIANCCMPCRQKSKIHIKDVCFYQIEQRNITIVERRHEWLQTMARKMRPRAVLHQR
jgi:hypothetical protein